MKATEVYSWRVQRHVKEALEAAAKSEHTSVAALLSRIVREWLRRDYDVAEEQRAQNCVREEAAQYLGSIRGNDPLRATQSAERVRHVIREKHASRRTD